MGILLHAYMYMYMSFKSYIHLAATLKVHKKFNFDLNQPKLSTQHKYMYTHQKKL